MPYDGATFEHDAAGLLDETARFLEEDLTRWKRHVVNQDNQHFCVIGALSYLAHVGVGEFHAGEGAYAQALQALRTTLIKSKRREHSFVSTGTFIGHWNDEPERTVDDVIAALREARDYVRLPVVQVVR